MHRRTVLILLTLINLAKTESSMEVGHSSPNSPNDAPPGSTRSEGSSASDASSNDPSESAHLSKPTSSDSSTKNGDVLASANDDAPPGDTLGKGGSATPLNGFPEPASATQDTSPDNSLENGDLTASAKKDSSEETGHSDKLSSEKKGEKQCDNGVNSAMTFLLNYMIYNSHTDKISCKEKLVKKSKKFTPGVKVTLDCKAEIYNINEGDISAQLTELVLRKNGSVPEDEEVTTEKKGDYAPLEKRLKETVKGSSGFGCSLQNSTLLFCCFNPANMEAHRKELAEHYSERDKKKKLPGPETLFRLAHD